MIFKEQKDFPKLEDYRKKFKITPDTIFAYDNTIYCDKALSKDLIVHEAKHLERQNKLGIERWVEKYLKDDKFRLEEEIIAFKAQLAVIKDRNDKMRVRIQSARDLSSDLYGGIISNFEAFKVLK